ncbi:MAG: hypothetical protein K6G80_03490 [Treponema sp.]|nr:hypothetical protein [Treponema sp.]
MRLLTTEAIIYFSLLVVALLLYIAVLVSIPVRRRRTLAAAGACLMPLSAPSSKKWVAIAVVAGLVLLAVPLRNYGLVVSAVLLAAAVLGAEIAAREAAGSGRAGIYENMLILGTSAIRWSDIASLPTLSYEDDPDTTQVDKTTLRVLLEDGSEQLVLFSDEEERRRAVEKILERAPELRP